MRFLTSFLRIGAVVFLFGTLLAACVVEETPGPGPGRPFPPDRPQFCTREYAPVCGQRRGDRQTFPNACQAEADGYRVIARGECRSGGGGGGGPRACTREYNPVCARRGGTRQTFSNSCEAENAGFRIISGGECRGGGGGGGGGEEPRFCTREYAPVCARRGGDRRTFPNSCEADNAGYRVISDGGC
ncbi:Kazal-type serine protease inhibitor domain-containing protein [Mesorhizobium sp. ZC-5]|uniref:Kazal-type serine protease inhibitor domain-containing protein n=1 Tax=Mesorhizobium sp. ZC-5 TaxID=2986066 RepID=UPI0021E829ED|nr:Kazal-type serine protease inhibitor domain-containing protein [Mesorhizobium sp. ZC-5]MCV3242959.1 Kazal-type serine protease inhibitor domain-containing protein [Mesorhizobium sp. ZC-5]